MPEAQTRLYTLLVVREVGKPDRIVIWDTQEITLGRAPENDIAVDQAEISRQQALFSRQDDTYVVKNLSTSNATQVNGEERKAHRLQHKDIVRVGELQLQFVQTRKNPATLGLKMTYSSQLKDFGGPQIQNAEATTLGLMDALPPDENDESFRVAPAGAFEYDLHGIDAQPAKARDLDEELDDLGLGGPAPQSAPSESWSLDEFESPAAAATPAAATPAAAPAAAAPARAPASAPSQTLSLHLEISGLDPAFRRLLESFVGKTLALPQCTLRIKDDDLG